MPPIGRRLLPALALLACTVLPATPSVAQSAPRDSTSALGDIPARPAGAPAKTWERALVRALRPTPAGVHWQLNVSESVVEAVDLRDVSVKLAEGAQAMMAVRSARAPGSSSWSLSTPWEMETHLSRCQFKDIEVRLGYDLDVVMLGGPVAQDPAAVAAWERRLDQTWEGTVRRLRVMREDAKGLFRDLRLLSNQNCGELAQIASNRAREVRFLMNDHIAALGARTTPMADRIP